MRLQGGSEVASGLMCTKSTALHVGAAFGNIHERLVKLREHAACDAMGVSNLIARLFLRSVVRWTQAGCALSSSAACVVLPLVLQVVDG